METYMNINRGTKSHVVLIDAKVIANDHNVGLDHFVDASLAGTWNR